MEFNEKLQELRRQKGITQEELAAALFVSRTAVSKWESGRGYPNIESLKAISKSFSVTIDDLLSGDEILSVAEEDSRQTGKNIRDFVFGLIDCSAIMLLFLPLFGQLEGGDIAAVPLIGLTEIQGYLKICYLIIVIAVMVSGVLTLALQNWENSIWMKNKVWLSLAVNAAGLLTFIVSRQPYAAVFLFVFAAVKVLMLLKQR